MSFWSGVKLLFFYFFQEIADADEKIMTQTVTTEAEYSSAVSEAFNKVENELHLFQLYDFLYSMATADRDVIQERQWQVWNQYTYETLFETPIVLKGKENIFLL